MEPERPLTLTVEQAGQILGVSRSTAYELVQTGDLICVRLRRRIVVPVAHLAELLGVDPDTVCRRLDRPVPPSRSPRMAKSMESKVEQRGAPTTDALTLF